jgi:hypothetical protein
LAQEVAGHHCGGEQAGEVVSAGRDLDVEVLAGKHSQQALNVVTDDVLNVAAG